MSLPKVVTALEIGDHATAQLAIIKARKLRVRLSQSVANDPATVQAFGEVLR